MDERFLRTSLILGEEGMKRLEEAHVAVFGVGGVGSFTCEVLARSGVGQLSIIDYDIIDISNINRQIHALTDTVGREKVLAMEERLRAINPKIRVNTINKKILRENVDDFSLESFDYVVDAIDMISSKLALIEKCKEYGVPIISAMGAGNKLDPTRFKVSDIYETSVCPLSKVMRKELRRRNISDLKVVWSDEEPININLGDKDRRKAVPASIAFVPSVVGIIIGSEVIKDLSTKEEILC